MIPENSAPIQLNKPSDVEKRMILKKISEMENLPTPSESIMKVMLILRSKEVPLDQIVEAIERDQALVAQILKMVNSSYYTIRTRITSVEQAVSMLGLDNIKQIVYSALIMDFFSPDEQVEWHHAYSSSLLMANLIKGGEIHGVEMLPLAMILHDIGKVVLRKFCPQKYKLAHMNAAKTRKTIFECEMESIGVSHADAGALLLEKWGTSGDIVTPVLQHHMVDVPDVYVFETALMQYVNWVDDSARGIPCRRPASALLDAAGIEDIDDNYWLEYQRGLITRLECPVADDSTKESIAPDGMQKTKKIDKPVARGSFSPNERDVIARSYKKE